MLAAASPDAISHEDAQESFIYIIKETEYNHAICTGPALVTFVLNPGGVFYELEVQIVGL
jgi:hypothetical protein